MVAQDYHAIGSEGSLAPDPNHQSEGFCEFKADSLILTG